jgi:hypothetical protein
VYYDGNASGGFCRRNPPEPGHTDEIVGLAKWPKVSAQTDWCGGHLTEVQHRMIMGWRIPYVGKEKTNQAGGAA